MRKEEHEYRGIKINLYKKDDYMGFNAVVEEHPMGYCVKLGIGTQEERDAYNEDNIARAKIFGGLFKPNNRTVEQDIREHFDVLLINAKESIDELLK